VPHPSPRVVSTRVVSTRVVSTRTAAVGLLLVVTGLSGTSVALASSSSYAPVQRTNIDRALPVGATLLPSGRLVSPHGTAYAQGDFPLGLALSPDGRLAVATGVGQGSGTPGGDFGDLCRDGQKKGPCYGDGRLGSLPSSGPDEGLFVTDLQTGARTQLRGPATSCAPNSDPAKSAPFACFEDGVVFAPDGTHVYAAGGGNDAVYSYAVGADHRVGPQPAKVTYLQEANGAPAGSGAYQSPNPGTTAARTKGMAVTPDGAYLLVLKEQSGSMDILRTSDLSFVRKVPLGPPNLAGANGSASYPYAVAVAEDGSAAYVTLQGLGMLATVPLTAGAGTLVAGPPTFVLAGANPTGLALRGRSLLVTGANDDSVTAYDTTASTLLPVCSPAPCLPAPGLSVHAEAGEQTGAVPNAVAFAGPDRAYVALAGDNALAVLDRTGGTWAQTGLVPTGWYPTGVAVRPGGEVVALAAKGLGSGYDPAGGYPTPPPTGGPQAVGPGYYDGNNMPGLLSALPAPGAAGSAALAADTAEVLRNLHFAAAADPGRSGTVIPTSEATAGQSAIKHVVYIVRENRTYDQVFGDLARTRNDVDADPAYESLASATPNAHALAGRYASSDSFFSAGEASVQGHFWTTSANVDDYVEKSWRQYYSDRSHSADEISATVAFPKNCSIFQVAQAKATKDPTFTYTDFGDPVGAFNPQVPAGSGVALGLPSGPAAGTGGPNTCAATPAQVNPSSFSSFLGVDDRKFASEFLLQSGLNPDGSPIAGAAANQQLRSLSYVELPGDHTTGFGASVENHTPRAQIAENDAAVATVISAVSKSKYWDSTAVFVVEDDSQDGPDHVDGHRNILLVASPYARQTSANSCYPGYVSHVHTDQSSVLRTIELMLGLPALSSYDQKAAPLYDVFQDKSSPAQLTATDLAPFSPVPSAPFVEEKIGDPSAGTAAHQTALRQESSHLDLTAIDRAGPLLEDVLWKSTRGGPPPAELRAALARAGQTGAAGAAEDSPSADRIARERAQAVTLASFGRVAQAGGAVDCSPTASGGGVPVGLPESPLPIGLPLAAVLLGLGVLAVDRLRRGRAARVRL